MGGPEEHQTLSKPTSSADTRRHPRYPAALPARIKGLPLLTRNISRSGVQVSCHSMNFALMFGTAGSDTVEIEIDLPGEDRFIALYRVVYASPIDEDHLVGLELT